MEQARILEHLERPKPEVILDKSDFPFIKDLIIGDKCTLEIDGVVVRERLIDDKLTKTAEIIKSRKIIDNRRVI
jgi:hypothetical protein